MKEQEIVLPSGRFARIRPIKWEDFVLSYDTDLYKMITKLTTRCVTIDGTGLTYQQVLDLDLDEMLPINTLLGDMATNALANRKGIA